MKRSELRRIIREEINSQISEDAGKVDYTIIKGGYYDAVDGLGELKDSIGKLIKKHPNIEEVKQLKKDFDSIWKTFNGPAFSKVGKAV